MARIVGSPEAFGYRNQAKLVLRHSARGGLLAGLYRPNTHTVMDIRQCPVHHPYVRAALERILPVLAASRIPTYDERTGQGVWRYLVVRASRWTKAVQVIVVCATELDARVRPVLRQLARLPRVRSVVHNFHPSPGNVIFGELFTPVTRETALAERIGSWTLKTHPGAFLQANIPVARKLYAYATAAAALRDGDVVADLYCGAGALTFHLAPSARLVVGVEESPVAAADARSNVRWNGFSNVRIWTATASDGVQRLPAELGHVDLLTLNPPRKGTDENTRAGILRLAPRRIVYVSCDPGTLLRDLLWFEAHGYRTEQLQPFDMFPQTEHIECVATLARQH